MQQDKQRERPAAYSNQMRELLRCLLIMVIIKSMHSYEKFKGFAFATFLYAHKVNRLPAVDFSTTASILFLFFILFSSEISFDTIDP